jgi:hypothetical protein
MRGRIMEIRPALDREIGVRIPAPQWLLSNVKVRRRGEPSAGRQLQIWAPASYVLTPAIARSIVDDSAAQPLGGAAPTITDSARAPATRHAISTKREPVWVV